ncbi:hypothetical protein O181_005201 [Austropuccinia psidii MF-1]|uniref:Uncharacterized protein n=1 Tax=Austropuccinia psidii MF-1 TaxID=1389203 RepID=A0A9Q3BIE7_9BASI|nr:hypothetical protein [Austropuccinia psidii MF-1]
MLPPILNCPHTNKCLHQILNGNQTEHEDNDSLQVSPNLTNENMEPSMEDCHIIQNNYEDLPSQTSTQRPKKHTNEEAKFHQQKLEHEHMLKRQKQENNCFNVEAQRLKQVERCLAQESHD